MSIVSVSKELFELLRGRFPSLKMGDDTGAITLQPNDAKFFEFEYKDTGKKVGDVVVSIIEADKVKVYYTDQMVNELAGDGKDSWYMLLKDLSKFSTRNMLNYEAINIEKERLDKKDFEHMTNKDKSKDDEVMEGKLYGSKQKSYQDLNGAKLIVQHRKTVDEEKMGSRSRNIKAIYIENSEGERFKFVNNYLPGARAMARHVSNGGYPNDPAGSHIAEIMKEMQDLKHFVRKVKSNEYVDEDAREVIDCATDRYYGLKNTLVGLNKQKGYTDYFENWEPNEIEVDENDLDDLRAKLTRSEFDDRLTDSLSAVGRAMKLREKKEGEFFDYPQWVKAAKRNGADIEGDVKSSVAMVNGKEIGSWEQTIDDLEAPKTGSSVKEPGYGEINMGSDDRGEGPQREFTVPNELEMMPGQPSWKGMQFTDNNGLLTAVLRDIADRAKDDEIAIFAADMATHISSEGGTFGKRMDDEQYKSDKKKAVALAKMAIQAAKNEAVGESGSGDQPISSMSRADLIDYLGTSEKEVADMSDDELRDAANDKASDYAEAKDPMSAFEDSMNNIINPKSKIVEGTMVCEDCGCECHNPKPGCDCPHDCNDESGSWWVMSESKVKEAENEVKRVIAKILGTYRPLTDDDFDNEDLNSALYDYFVNSGEMPYGTAKARDGDPDEWIYDKLESLGMVEDLQEGRMSDIHLEITQMIDDGESDEDIMAAFPGLVSMDQLKRMRAEEMDRPAEYDESMNWLKKAAGIGSSARSNFGMREGEQGYRKSLRDDIGKYLATLKK